MKKLLSLILALVMVLSVASIAGAEELTELPGVGETISALIVAERDANGPFYYAEDLESVRGIGPATLAGCREMIDLSQEEGRN